MDALPLLERAIVLPPTCRLFPRLSMVCTVIVEVDAPSAVTDDTEADIVVCVTTAAPGVKVTDAESDIAIPPKVPLTIMTSDTVLVNDAVYVPSPMSLMVPITALPSSDNAIVLPPEDKLLPWLSFT